MLLMWGLWSLAAALMQGEMATSSFLPPAMERMLQDFGSFFEQNQETLAKDPFESAVDISKLPANYHNEEKLQRKLGNATMYSHHEINKLTDNRTGDVMFSEKTVTSIEVTDGEGAKEKEKEPIVKQEENVEEPTKKEPTKVRFFNLTIPEHKPRLAFLIFRLPQQAKRELVPESTWTKDETVSDRKHRLLAIRNGLLAAPHPIKKIALIAAPNHKLVPRKHHFSFLWRKI